MLFGGDFNGDGGDLKGIEMIVIVVVVGCGGSGVDGGGDGWLWWLRGWWRFDGGGKCGGRR